MDAATSKPETRRISGAEIQARIEANRLKRLNIAEAMKAEAGVTEHRVWDESRGGLAWIDHGMIQSPEGRKITQLYIVAHECGHIFLHSIGTPGYRLPSHVKELEAESYAHQCFIEHGMRMPKRISDWGRTYVGSWIDKDRAAGVRIDPRAGGLRQRKTEPVRTASRRAGDVDQVPRSHEAAQPKESVAQVRTVGDHAAYRANARHVNSGAG